MIWELSRLVPSGTVGAGPDLNAFDRTGTEEVVSRLRLKGKRGSYVIASEFWDDILTWAEENGWSPEHERDWYEALDSCVRVSTTDAVNLAETLEFIAGEIVLHEMDDVSDEFIRQLVDSLMQLTVLFQADGFEIAPCN